MPSTSELSPIASQHGTAGVSSEPVRVGIQPLQHPEAQRKDSRNRRALSGALGFLALHYFMKPIATKPRPSSTSRRSSPTPSADDHDHDRQYESFLEQQITAATRYETLQKALDAYPGTPGHRSFPPNPNRTAITRLQKALKVEQVGTELRSLDHARKLPKSEGISPTFVNADHRQLSRRCPQ